MKEWKSAISELFAAVCQYTSYFRWKKNRARKNQDITSDVYLQRQTFVVSK